MVTVLNSREEDKQQVTDQEGITRLSEVFETSARRWELIIYPSMFAFVVLAAYGFFLIYRLAGDMHYMVISVDTHMSVLSSNMQSMSENMGQMTTNIRTMTVSLDSMEHKMGTLQPILASMESMDKSMKSLNASTQAMTYATQGMQHDMSRLNTNVGRPMSFMNSFMPW
jgi:methyl-accepting chemotaxis protein